MTPIYVTLVSHLMSHPPTMTDDNNQDRIRDAADKILMGEFVRLANDYKQGKRLTGGERSFVQRMAVRFDPSLSQGPWAASATELASIFGCTRRTICRWKKLPDCPQPAADGRHNVAAWREFIRRNGLEAGFEDEEDLELGADAKQRRAAVLADREEFEFAILKGDYLRQDDVRRWLGEMITAVKVELMNSAVRTASSLVGLTAGEILDRLRTENTRVLRHLHEEPWADGSESTPG